jgi:flagellar hook-associated protein 2
LAALFSASGRTSDSLVTFLAQTSATQPGTYAVDVTALATRGTLVGSAAANLTITGGVNDQIEVTLNGVVATVTLVPGTYTATSLAAMVQASINGNTTLSSQGAQVTVAESSGILTFTSTRYGSVSTMQLSGSGAAGLVGVAPVATAGLDVGGTIGSSAATGSGQTLTATVGAVQGLKLSIAGDSTGDRGTVTVASGFADRLSRLLDGFLSSSGAIASRTDGIGRSIKDLDSRRDELNRRLADIEKRYRAQFTALDGMITQMQATSTFLTQQLAKLPDPTK